MSETITTTASRSPQKSVATRAFWICWMALFASGFAMMLKLSLVASIKSTFFDATQPLQSASLIGAIMGITYLGFTICNIVLPPLIDALKIKRVLMTGLITFIIGIVTMSTATPDSPYAFEWLWIGALLHGIGWGCVEAVVNPVVPSLFPDKKAAMLNRLHASWPLGWLVAGVILLCFEHAPWNLLFAVSLIPVTLALVMLLFAEIPPTERVATGVSFKGMFKEVLIKPGILVLVFVMFLGMATETVPQNWLDIAIGKASGISGTWLLLYVAAAYFVARSSAEIVLKKVHPVIILLGACAILTVALVGLTYSNSKLLILTSTAALGFGSALLWPNLLAVASARYPNTGSLGIGLMCSAGMASGYVLVPWLGQIFDEYKIQAAGGAEAFEKLTPESLRWMEVNAIAAEQSFRIFAVLPAFLALYFLLDYLFKVWRKKS